MAYTVEDVVQRHRELTAEIAVISQRHSQELEPLNKAIKAIEMWLLAKMNQEGIQSYKTPHGTAYQSRLTSIKQDDPIAFRNFVLRPAMILILQNVVEGPIDEVQIEAALDMVSSVGLWDLADFRPGKKGVIKYQEEHNQQVPGVSLTELINVNVRGS